MTSDFSVIEAVFTAESLLLVLSATDDFDMCSGKKQIVLFEHIVCAVSWMVGTLWLNSKNVLQTSLYHCFLQDVLFCGLQKSRGEIRNHKWVMVAFHIFFPSML